MDPVDRSSRVSAGKAENPDAAAVVESQQTKPHARLFSETSSADAAAPQPARKKLKKKKGNAKPRSASSASKPVKAERKAGARRKPARASAAQTAQGPRVASQTVEVEFSGMKKQFKTSHGKDVDRALMIKDVYDLIYEEKGKLKIYGLVQNGFLSCCYFFISRNATGVMGEDRARRKAVWIAGCKNGKKLSTKIYLHHAVALVTGFPSPNFSTNRGGITIDHKDENPANNVMENLRGMRTELNGARKCDPDGVQRPPYGKGHESEGKPTNFYQYTKPMYNYIKRSTPLWQKAKDCDELKDAGFFGSNSPIDRQIKIRDTKTGDTITDDEARERAVARKRAQGRSVFAFLRREDPDLFKGWKPERDAAGKWHWVEADFFDEFVTKWL
jgi:hypothetical protein